MLKATSSIPTALRKNVHFFIPVLSLSLFEMLFAYFYTDFTEHEKGYDYSTLVLLFMTVSIPFSILDPPVWFGIYMTTFVHFLYIRGLFTFSIIALIVMFLSLFAHQIRYPERVLEDEIVILVK